MYINTHPLTPSPTHPAPTYSPTHTPTTHLLTHSSTHPPTHSLTHPLTHSPTHPVTHSPTHSPTPHANLSSSAWSLWIPSKTHTPVQYTWTNRLFPGYGPIILPPPAQPHSALKLSETPPILFTWPHPPSHWLWAQAVVSTKVLNYAGSQWLMRNYDTPDVLCESIASGHIRRANCTSH